MKNIISTVVLNRPENIWLLNRMHLNKQCDKNYNTKICLKTITMYSSNNTMSSFKQMQHLSTKFFKNFNEIVFLSDSQPANKN